MRIDIGFAEDLISKALRKGAEQAEVYISSSKNLSVEVKGQAIDSLKSSLGFGYSLRVIREGRLGFSYANDIHDMNSVLNDALHASQHSDKDIFLDLPEATGIKDVEIYDLNIADLREEDAVARVMDLERAAYNEDNRIKKIRKASGSFTSSETAIFNFKGVKARYSSTSCSAQITAVAEEGDESQMGWDYEGSRFLHNVSFEDIGRKAARRAVQLLGSGKMEGRKSNVIFDNSVTVDFLGIVASSFSSENVQKGKSLFTGKLHKRVISPKVNIIDSGLLRGRLGSSPVDDEGVCSEEKILIKEGVLQSYLYNTYTARKENTVSTGNAVRSGFSSLPSVGISNLYLEPVSKSDVIPADKLFATAGSGLYVIEAMGVHTANPISGEFSIGVTGLWIEDGEVKYPVKEAVISGNIMELFDKIEAIGDDLRFYGNIGGPSLIISDIDISG